MKQDLTMAQESVRCRELGYISKLYYKAHQSPHRCDCMICRKYELLMEIMKNEQEKRKVKEAI